MLAKLVGVLSKQRNRRLNSKLFREFVADHPDQGYILASFPRSGNTWMRTVLSHLISSEHDPLYEGHLNAHPDEIIPDDWANQLKKLAPWASNSFVMMKSHRLFMPLNKDLDARAKYILLVREPADTLVSYFYFHLRYPKLSHVEEKGIDAFVLEKSKDYMSYIESYLNSGLPRERLKVVRYEDMIDNPLLTIENLSNWIGIDVLQGDIKVAIEASEFKKLHKDEKQNPINEDHFFFRKGVVGDGKRQLDPTTYEQVDKLTSSSIKNLFDLYSD